VVQGTGGFAVAASGTLLLIDLDFFHGNPTMSPLGYEFSPW
jgi:hypothetical protein